MRGLDLGGGIGSIVYQKKSSDYYYYHYNHKGDVVALTDGNRDHAAYYEYDAWGNTMTEAKKTGVDNPVERSRHRRDYSTKEWDENSGLYYFGARYYSPEIGRWTQRNPAGVADGLNLYGYVRNSPPSLLDPWGAMVVPGTDPSYAHDPDQHIPRPPNVWPKPWEPDYHPPECPLKGLLDFLECVGNCIDANKFDWQLFLDWWGISQVAGNLFFAERVPEALGRPAHLSSWQHTLFRNIGEKMGWGTRFRHVGKYAGHAGVALTVAEGWYMLGVEISCSAICAFDPDAY